MKKLLLLTLLLIPASAFADSYALATATIDWCACAWTTSGTISIAPVPRAFNTSGISSDGILQATADAHGIDGGDTVYRHTGGFIDDTYFLVGTGTGSLTFTLPYTLTASCVDASYGDPSSAVSMVSLSLFSPPNGPALSTQIESLNCRGGESRSGVLTVSSQFVEPIGGLVLISVRANADSIAPVSEAPSLTLLPLGLIAIGVLRRRRSQRVA